MQAAAGPDGRSRRRGKGSTRVRVWARVRGCTLARTRGGGGSNSHHAEQRAKGPWGTHNSLSILVTFHILSCGPCCSLASLPPVPLRPVPRHHPAAPGELVWGA